MFRSQQIASKAIRRLVAVSSASPCRLAEESFSRTSTSLLTVDPRRSTERAYSTQKTIGESLLGIKETKEFVESATSNEYVKSRLASLLDRPVGGSGEERTSSSSGDRVDELDEIHKTKENDVLELFRLHNSSMLDQLSQGHMVKATVVQVDKWKAILDMHNGKFATIGIHELTEDAILERKSKTGVGMTESQQSSHIGSSQVLVGDTVQVFLESIETPEGELLVTGQESAVSRRTKAVWGELLERLNDGRPVKGRLLNSLAGGYSVGVAGIVCFLPNRNASKVTVGRIGELADYRVIQMNASRSNVVLSDCRLKRGGERGEGGKRRGGGQGGRGNRRGGELLRY
jgi:hypothetical protein